MTVDNRGDPYVLGVSASVNAVMECLERGTPAANGLRGREYTYHLAWQSQVGPHVWMGPQTSDALKGFAKLGKGDIVRR